MSMRHQCTKIQMKLMSSILLSSIVRKINTIKVSYKGPYMKNKKISITKERFISQKCKMK